MLFKFQKYIQFLLQATNQHGVHSPFVYNLVTKCFYDKKKRNSYIILKSNYKKKNNASLSFKNIKLLNRIPLYLKYKNICILSPIKSFPEIIFTANNTVSIHTSLESHPSFDLIYIDLDMSAMHKINFQEIVHQTHNDSLLLLKGISTSNKNRKYWESIIQLTDITVSIDTFYLGFIFFRKEQVKEHFIIRS